MNRFQQITHQECIVLLTDDLAEKLTGEDGFLTQNPQKFLLIHNPKLITDLSYILTIMASINNINTPTVETTSYETAKYIEKLLSSFDKHIKNNKLSFEDHLNLLYLSICYLIAGKKHKHNYWHKQAAYYIEHFNQ